MLIPILLSSQIQQKNIIENDSLKKVNVYYKDIIAANKIKIEWNNQKEEIKLSNSEIRFKNSQIYYQSKQLIFSDTIINKQRSIINTYNQIDSVREEQIKFLSKQIKNSTLKTTLLSISIPVVFILSFTIGFLIHK